MRELRYFDLKSQGASLFVKLREYLGKREGYELRTEEAAEGRIERLRGKPAEEGMFSVPYLMSGRNHSSNESEELQKQAVGF